MQNYISSCINVISSIFAYSYWRYQGTNFVVSHLVAPPCTIEALRLLWPPPRALSTFFALAFCAQANAARRFAMERAVSLWLRILTILARWNTFDCLIQLRVITPRESRANRTVTYHYVAWAGSYFPMSLAEYYNQWATFQKAKTIRTLAPGLETLGALCAILNAHLRFWWSGCSEEAETMLPKNRLGIASTHFLCSYPSMEVGLSWGPVASWEKMWMSRCSLWALMQQTWHGVPQCLENVVNYCSNSFKIRKKNSVSVVDDLHMFGGFCMFLLGSASETPNKLPFIPCMHSFQAHTDTKICNNDK